MATNTTKKTAPLTDKELANAIFERLAARKNKPISSKALQAEMRKSGLTFSDKRFSAVKRTLERKGIITSTREGVAVKTAEYKQANKKKPKSRNKGTPKCDPPQNRGVAYEEVSEVTAKLYKVLRNAETFTDFSSAFATYTKSICLLAFKILQQLRENSTIEGNTSALACLSPNELSVSEQTALRLLLDMGLVKPTESYICLV